MNNNYLIRADAAFNIGTGHVMRMIALGQMLKDKGKAVHFATVSGSKSITDRILCEGFKLHKMNNSCGELELQQDAMKLIRIAQAHNIKWIILDGYGFNVEYQQLLKGEGFCLMCVDDIAKEHFAADILLNQNINAGKMTYSTEGYTRFFLGPQHVLLRREFISAKNGFKRKISKKIKNILVTMGGGDVGNITARVLNALTRLKDKTLHIKAIIGPVNHNYRNIIKSGSSIDIEVLHNVDYEMPELMKWADLGIVAGGSTIFEAQYLGLPLLCCNLVSHQKINYVPLDSLNEDVYGEILSELRSLADFYVVKDLEVKPFDVKCIA
jgi:UDP-2,4-diacetamido-2,4,6-trideoxy-beta-L-altropyranose hydrolase